MLSIQVNAQEKIHLEYQEWELKSFKENKVLISEQEGVWLDNISEPEMDLYRAKGDSITDKAMIICPGGGLFFSAYEKEGVKLAKKLASKGITAVVLKYRTYPKMHAYFPSTQIPLHPVQPVTPNHYSSFVPHHISRHPHPTMPPSVLPHVIQTHHVPSEPILMNAAHKYSPVFLQIAFPMPRNLHVMVDVCRQTKFPRRMLYISLSLVVPISYLVGRILD